MGQRERIRPDFLTLSIDGMRGDWQLGSTEKYV